MTHYKETYYALHMCINIMYMTHSELTFC